MLARPASLNQLAKECHEVNQHWWHDPATGKRLDRNRGEMFALMHSELSECLEGFRKDLMDTHLPHRKAEEVELADLMIRVLDYAGERGLDLDEYEGSIIKTYGYGLPDGSTPKGEYIAHMHNDLSCASEDQMMEAIHLGHLVRRVIVYCKIFDLDLWGAIVDKRAYNLTRQDHTNAARLAVGGKRF